MYLQTILTWTVTFLAIVVAGFYVYFKRSYTYWRKRNVPHAIPKIPFGDFANFGRKISAAEIYLERYMQFKDEKFFGTFTFHRPSLVVNDLDLIKTILVKDFPSFHDHSIYYNERDDPLSANLFTIKGSQWKNLRTKLSPTFSPGKMKSMFPIVSEVGDLLLTVLDKAVVDNNNIIEVKDLIAGFSTDIIASCAFGIESKSLENTNSIFRVMGRKIFESSWSVVLKSLLMFIVPDLAEFFRLVLQKKSVTDFFMGILKETVDYRKENNVIRKDFMDMMIELMDKGFIADDGKEISVKMEEEKLTFNQAAAQVFIFFAAGFETAASSLQFTMYELAKNQDVQNKLRQEILGSLKKNGGKFTFEGVHELEYLGMVLEESLRKYPVVGILNRECNQTYNIPGTSLVLEKGTTIVIPVYGLHMDPKYYPEPEKFIPERFLEEEKAKRVHYTYLPFGGGPRYCIGQRFAMMEMRVALAFLLSKFRIGICEKTPRKIVIDIRSLILQSEGGMYLKLKKLSLHDFSNQQ